MRKFEKDHFAAIDQSRGIYVYCPEGRIGLLVSAEIGYTKAQKKPVYARLPEDLGLQALVDKIVEIDRLDLILV